MKIDLKVDNAQLLLRMRNGQKKLAYAVVNAIRKTAKRVQQAEFAHVRQKFQIRKPTFFFGTPDSPGGVAARIEVFPSVKQARPYAEIAVSASSQASQRRTLFGIFEHGGTKDPRPGSKTVAVPITGRPARPRFTGPVPPQFTFQGLAFRAYKRGKVVRKRRRGGNVPETIFGEFGRIQRVLGRAEELDVQWKGKERTFIIRPGDDGLGGGVFQRFGKERGDIRTIYSFEKSPPLDDRLEFIPTAERTANEWFGEEMEREVFDVFEHDRGRSF